MLVPMALRGSAQFSRAAAYVTFTKRLSGIMEQNCPEQSDITVGSLGRHVLLRNRLRKTLYYGKYSDASLPSLPVADVAVETLNTAVPTAKRILDKKHAMAVSRRARVNPCTLMMGMLYTERLGQQNPMYLSKVSSSDLFLISIMMASKYLYDEGEEEEVFNEDWARAGGKCVKDVNTLEMEFLASIEWNLFVSADEFLSFVNKVETRVAVSHGLARGWFTYTDISTLLDNMTFYQTLNMLKDETLKVFCLCTAAYVTAVSIAVGCAVFMPSVVQLAALSSPHLSVTPVPPLFCNSSKTSCSAFTESLHWPGPQNMSAVFGNEGFYRTETNQVEVDPQSVAGKPHVKSVRNISTGTSGNHFKLTALDCQGSRKNFRAENIFLLDKTLCTLMCMQPHFIYGLAENSLPLSVKLSGLAVMQNSSVCVSNTWSL